MCFLTQNNISIIGEIKYDSDKNKIGPIKIANATQLCSETELYLRLYQYKRKDDKYWFLTPEQLKWTLI